VISQDPAAGDEVEEGTAVEVVVSTGAAGAGGGDGVSPGGQSAVTVPETIGLFETEAVAAIEGAGLTASVVQDFSGAGELGRVLSSNPPGGSQVLPGTVITLFVASLPGE
jgi:serine/threonine-protein kinase